jgi:hypothetical protein
MSKIGGIVSLFVIKSLKTQKYVKNNILYDKIGHGFNIFRADAELRRLY